MRKYPSIDREIIGGQKYYCFDKLDGSNIRVEWNRKKSFCKFGSRNRMIDESELILGKAIPLVKALEGKFHDLFIQKKQQRVILFFEFYGSNSFAGFHEEDDEFRVTLIDASLYKKGMIEPKEFIRWFEEFDTARFLYHGNINQPFIESVESGALEGMTYEGIVGKAVVNPKRAPVMTKIKSNDWLSKLNAYCGNDHVLFRKLV
jgi:hypothetical protein